MEAQLKYYSLNKADDSESQSRKIKKLIYLSRKLFNWTEEMEIVKNTCEYYGTPTLKDILFSYKSGYFKIIAYTNNEQKWTVKFTNIDNNGLLLNKFIEAEKL